MIMTTIVILIITTRSAGDIILTSACLCVCLSVCQHDNFWIVRDIV